VKNRRVVLKSRPAGVAQADNFALVEEELAPLAEGTVRIRTEYLSVEPAMRGWIADKGNYLAPVEIGATMRALAVGEVVESRADEYRVGDVVTGWFGWQSFSDASPAAIVRKVRAHDLPRSLALGVLGINGVTALIGLDLIGEPRAGDCVVVSTAAGAVGSAVGQIAKLRGCRTVGIAGGPDKTKLCLNRFGYDAAIDYRAGNIGAALAEACPKGVDVYFDNTSGAVSDAVYPHLAAGARVVICGTASISAWDPWPTGPRLERHLLVKRARAQGFVIFDHLDRWEACIATLADWVRNGDLRYEEDILDGLDACPDALAGLYRGENKGKRLIRL
jgi:NADPH-dependent curcumin reductase CurA